MRLFIEEMARNKDITVGVRNKSLEREEIPSLYRKNLGKIEDAVGGYRFRIERSKIDHNSSIIMRSGDCSGQGRYYDTSTSMLDSCKETYAGADVFQTWTYPVVGRFIRPNYFLPLVTGSRVFSLTCPLGFFGARTNGNSFPTKPRSEA
ncbi:hypothetical protein TNCV_4769541 [Trichonephila clavipes]|nr:hypothetical protein TNCV_4769541 [Trichonephila clavipes]